MSVQTLLDSLIADRAFGLKRYQDIVREKLLMLVQEQLPEQYQLSDQSRQEIEREADVLNRILKRAWRTTNRSKQKLKTKFSNTERVFNVRGKAPDRGVESSAEESEDVTQESPETRRSRSAGRPSTTPFAQLGDRQRRRVASAIGKTHSPLELVEAARQRASASGHADTAYVLRQVGASPSRPSKIRRTLTTPPPPKVECYSGEDALAVSVAADLSVRAYKLIRRMTEERTKAHVWPSYDTVLSAKSQCYPDDVSVTDTSAETTLQALLDHTTSRLVTTLKELPELVEGSEDESSTSAATDSATSHDAVLHLKWGFDGATGQSVYKQSGNVDEAAEQSLLCTTIVPLQLVVGGKPVWTNPSPSSTGYCRPLRIQYKRETVEASRHEHNQVQEEIRQLKPTYATAPEGVTLRVTYDLQLTMIDGKVANAITGTSSMSCSICGCKPTQMNDLRAAQKRPIKPEACQLGLSTVHAWIRCFEYIFTWGTGWR